VVVAEGDGEWAELTSEEPIVVTEGDGEWAELTSEEPIVVTVPTLSAIPPVPQEAAGFA
jgi:hypothetical protein